MRLTSLSLFCLLGSCASFMLPHTNIRNIVRRDCSLTSTSTFPPTFPTVSHRNLLPSYGASLSKTNSNKNRNNSKRLNKHLKVATLATTMAAGLLLFTQPASASELIGIINDKASDSGFLQAFLLIFVSELGDKTFFIAGLLAAKYGRFISFTGSLGALSVMTVISTVLGQLFHAVPTSLTQGIPFDDYIAVAAFSYFGIKTLYDASQLKGDDNAGILEEQAEAEKTVQELTADQKRKSSIALIVQTFSLVFAAEIGDRSFLSTIALSAALNPFAVAAG